MSPKFRVVLTGLAAVLLAAPVQAGDLTDGLERGTPDIKSAGPLAFGPQGILFVADTQGAAIFAIDTGDTKGPAGAINIKGIGKKVGALLGAGARDIRINDLAVNPASGRAYLSVSRGRGPNAAPVLVRVDTSGKIEEFSLQNVKFSKAVLPNAPDADAKDRRGRSQRLLSITDLVFADGRVFVAGLSNEEFASNLRAIPFPFAKTDNGTSIEIYHGAHGRFETRSPIRTFVAYDIKGETNLLAAYTCTPLVKFPVKQLRPGVKIKGTTVAELGNRNNPLDMIVYNKDGKDFLLLANSSRGVMKITTDGLDAVEAITERVGGGGTKGQHYDTIESLEGIVQLDRLDDRHALVLARTDDGALNLSSIPLP